MEDENIFFIGAGFSKAICSFPDLKLLSLNVKKHYLQDPNVTEEIKMHIERLPFYNNKSNFDKYDESDNIESILTYLLQDLPYKTRVLKSLDKAAYFDIVSYIGDYFRELPYHYNANACSYILEFILQNNVCCLSLNYDNLLEKLLTDYCKNSKIYSQIEDESLFYPYINENKISSGYTKLSDGSTGIEIFAVPMETENDSKNKIIPQIIKLHGSVNWALDYANNIITVKDNANKTPFIVPPVLDKSQIYNNNQLSDIWSLGYKKIKNAKNIFIYGFSFPSTDLSVKYLFQSALKENKNNPKIYVINIESDELIQHYKNDIFYNHNELLNFNYCIKNSLDQLNTSILSLKI